MPTVWPPLSGGTVSTAELIVAAGVGARVAAAPMAGLWSCFPGTTWRIRLALVLGLSIVALPAARAAAPAPTGNPLLIVAAEAVVGLGLGAAVAAALAAAAWAGGLLGSVSGLSWADEFGGEPGGDAAADVGGMARLAWWLAASGFLAAGGHLAIVAGVIDGLRTLPVGTVLETAAPRLVPLAAQLPALALALALSLAIPALVAVITFHVVAAICLRTVRFAPGQGLLQAAAALVLLAAVILGGDAWIGGAGRSIEPLVRETLATPAVH